jgi:Flp pilus assembly protein TadD
MMTVPQVFAYALQLHQAGRLDEAEALYRQILTIQQNHSGALHLLGVIVHQAGRSDLAIELIRRSIALNPQNPSAHSNLGEVYRALGQLDEAITSYHGTLQLQPDHPEALYNLGNALMGKGQADQAATAYRRAIQARPNYAEANVNLGTALGELKQHEEAIAAYRQALLLKPAIPEIHNNLGAALMKLERYEEALTAIRQALELKPDYAEAHNNQATILAANRQFDEAIVAFCRAIDLKPRYPQAHCNLGNALREIGRRDEAIASCRRALELDPNFSEAHNNLGSALLELGRLDEAESEFCRALELAPDFDDATVNHAMLLLLRGDYERGWPLYEARLRLTPSSMRDFAQPMWDGSPLQGRRVLIHAEQGFGDAIHFIRYAPLVAERGGEVIVECRAPLVELFRTVKGVHEVVADGDPLPPFDVHVPMLSLPLLFETGRATIPKDVPYLLVDPARRDIWKKRLGEHRPRLRIGLCWGGNPLNRRNRTRNISLECLRPLLDVKGIDFLSLQLNPPTEETTSSLAKAGIIDHTKEIRDFADTAAFMAELDLIITVDTAVAHLAGALGRPVWTLLPLIPDWRWGLEGTDTPWYPTMQLFRQTSAEDWAPVIERVAGALNE